MGENAEDPKRWNLLALYEYSSREELAQAMAYVCNYNCKWPWICEDKERLRAVHCAQCPLGKLYGDLQILS